MNCESKELALMVMDGYFGKFFAQHVRISYD